MSIRAFHTSLSQSFDTRVLTLFGLRTSFGSAQNVGICLDDDSGELSTFCLLVFEPALSGSIHKSATKK